MAAIEKIDLRLSHIDNDAERQKAINELTTLVTNPGWLFLVKVLRENLKRTEEVIFDEESDPETTRVYRKLRVFIKKMLQLPAEQMKVLGGAPEVEENPDPFYTGDEIEGLKPRKKR